MKVYANENLEEMSFISINFSTLFYKWNRKVSEKGEISLIVVAAPKVRQKEDDTDFQVFLSEIWKLSNNQRIVRLPIIEKLNY